MQSECIKKQISLSLGVIRRVGQRWPILILTGILVLFYQAASPVAALGAATPAESFDWNVPSLGIIKAPVGLEIAEIKEMRTTLSKQKQPTKGESFAKTDPEKLLDPAHPEAAMQLLNKVDQLEMVGYQLTMNDGSSYRLAWMIAGRDRQDVGALKDFFRNELSTERLLQLDILRQLLVKSKPEDLTFIDPKTKAGVRILEFTALDTVPQINGQGYSLGIRALLQAEDLKFPFYLRLHVFVNSNNQLAGAVFLSVDSEREFWDKIFQDMMAGL